MIIKNNMKKLYIYASDLHAGDAIGNYCMGLFQLGLRLGYEPILVAQRSTIGSDVQSLDTIITDDENNNVLIVNYSIYEQHLERLLAFCGHKLCYFHGITPPDLFAGDYSETAELCQQALEQLPSLQAFDRVVANSQLSVEQLSRHGVSQSVEVMPPVFADMNVLKHPFKTTRQHPARRTLLVVGRVVPHKKIEIAIDVLADLNSGPEQYHMKVVGELPSDAYFKRLLNHAKTADVLDAITFTGKVPNFVLHESYLQASALLSTSSHEGFCVPALESMYFGKPVFAMTGTAMDSFLISPSCSAASQAELETAIMQYFERPYSVEVAKCLHKHSLAILAQTSDRHWFGILNSEQALQ